MREPRNGRTTYIVYFSLSYATFLDVESDRDEPTLIIIKLGSRLTPLRSSAEIRLKIQNENDSQDDHNKISYAYRSKRNNCWRRDSRTVVDINIIRILREDDSVS